MSTTCTVCNTVITDKYCSNCGQLFTNKKASIWSLVVDFFGNFFSVDKSFIGTSRKLLTNPKFIVENFHQGNRRYYISPGSYILYGITIIAIHSLFFGSRLWGIELMTGGLAMQYALILILLPFLTLCSYFTFIGKSYNLSKHIISTSYNSTLFLIIFLVVDDLLLSIFGDLLGNFSMLFFFVFTSLWNSRVFSIKQKIGWHILNTIIQLVLFVGILMLLIFLFQNDTSAIE